LTLEELRAELARQAKLLTPEDQARLLQVIEAMQAGTSVEADVIRGLTADELREWSDHLGRKVD
jgi:hypothetical protein